MTEMLIALVKGELNDGNYRRNSRTNLELLKPKR